MQEKTVKSNNKVTQHTPLAISQATFSPLPRNIESGYGPKMMGERKYKKQHL